MLTALTCSGVNGWRVSLYRSLGVAAAACLTPQTARAECLGNGCYDGLVLILVLAAVAVLGAIVLALVLLPKRWRRIVLWGLGILVAASLIVPAVSELLQRRHLRAMEAREVVGQPPVLATRTPLIIADEGSCEMTTCAAVLLGMGDAGAFALPMSLADNLELSDPLVLSDLPLQHWTRDADQGGRPVVRTLDADGRTAAAEAIDYLVVTRAYYLSHTGPFDDALRSHASWQSLDEDVTLRFAMAPLSKVSGSFVFKDLTFDLVDLWSLRLRYGAPLYLGGVRDPVNTVAGRDTIAAALCPQTVDDWDCVNWLYD